MGKTYFWLFGGSDNIRRRWPVMTAVKMARNDGALKADSIGAVEAAAQSFGSMSPIMALCLVTPIIAAGAGLATPAAIMLAGIASLLCGEPLHVWHPVGLLLDHC